MAHRLVEIVRAKLHCRVGDYANAIGSVAGHEAAKSLFAPHLPQGFGYGHFVRIAACALDLEEDF